jgi:hypothetical protein
MKMNGVELITDERLRQIEGEGWTAEHDEQHTAGELAMVAALYATPRPVFVYEVIAGGHGFVDPWPVDWDVEYDKRVPGLGDAKQRIRILAKAGALVAAEIDRLQRLAEREKAER